jgi:hypothetical protein
MKNRKKKVKLLGKRIDVLSKYCHKIAELFIETREIVKVLELGSTAILSDIPKRIGTVEKEFPNLYELLRKVRDENKELKEVVAAHSKTLANLNTTVKMQSKALKSIAEYDE